MADSSSRGCVRSGPGAEQQMLTKGDNNQVDDRGLYAPGQHYLKRSDLLGRARGYVHRTDRVALCAFPRPSHRHPLFNVCVVRFCSVVRYVGMATILMNDYPWFKYVLLGLMGLFVLTSNESA